MKAIAIDTETIDLVGLPGHEHRKVKDLVTPEAEAVAGRLDVRQKDPRPIPRGFPLISGLP